MSSGLALVCWAGWGLSLLFVFSDGRVLDLAGAQRVIRRRDPFHLDDLGLIYGWRPVFRNLLNPKPGHQKKEATNINPT